MKRLTLAGLLAVSGSLAACGTDNPAPADAGTDTMVPTDTPVAMDTTPVDVTPADVTPADVATDRADAGGMTCGRLPYTTLMRAGNTTTVRGDNTQAWMDQTMGRPTGTSPVRPPTANRTCVPMSGQLVYAYTTGTAPGVAAHLDHQRRHAAQLRHGALRHPHLREHPRRRRL